MCGHREKAVIYNLCHLLACDLGCGLVSLSLSIFSATDTLDNPQGARIWASSYRLANSPPSSAPADSAAGWEVVDTTPVAPHLLLTEPLLPAKNIAQNRDRLLPTNKSNSGTIPELSEKSSSNKVAMKANTI